MVIAKCQRSTGMTADFPLRIKLKNNFLRTQVQGILFEPESGESVDRSICRAIKNVDKMVGGKIRIRLNTQLAFFCIHLFVVGLEIYIQEAHLFYSLCTVLVQHHFSTALGNQHIQVW